MKSLYTLTARGRSEKRHSKLGRWCPRSALSTEVCVCVSVSVHQVEMATPWLTYARAQDIRTSARRAVEQTLFWKKDKTGARAPVALLNISTDNKTIKYISPSNIFDRIRWPEGLRYSSSGKNSRNFHTLGMKWEIFKNWFFFIPKTFHTLKNNFIPYNFFSYLQSLFHTLKTFFIPLYINFIPWKFVSYLEKKFHTWWWSSFYCSYRNKIYYTTISYLVNFFLLYAVLSFHTKHQHFVLS